MKNKVKISKSYDLKTHVVQTIIIVSESSNYMSSTVIKRASFGRRYGFKT